MADIEMATMSAIDGDRDRRGSQSSLISSRVWPASGSERPASDAHSDSHVVAELRNVHKTYLLGIEGVPALRGVSLSVHRGEVVLILGKSGGGKTTLLNMLGTVDKPSRGEVVLSGRRISSKTPDDVLASIRLHNLGFVFQTFNLLPSMTAVENVEMPMVLAGMLTKKERRARATDLLHRVGMGHRLDHFPSQLSGGEQQRVTIARALANKPPILLLDEPTGDLDTKNSDIVMDLLLSLNETDKTTLVMVTHDIGMKAFVNRVVRMVDGKVASIEEVDEAARAEAVSKLRRSPWVAASKTVLTAPDLSTPALLRGTGGAAGSSAGAGAGSSAGAGAGSGTGGSGLSSPTSASASTSGGSASVTGSSRTVVRQPLDYASVRYRAKVAQGSRPSTTASVATLSGVSVL